LRHARVAVSVSISGKLRHERHVYARLRMPRLRSLADLLNVVDIHMALLTELPPERVGIGYA